MIATPAEHSKGLLLASIPDVPKIPPILVTKFFLEEEDLDPKDANYLRERSGLLKRLLPLIHHPRSLVFNGKLRNSLQHSLSTLLHLVSQELRGEVKTFDGDDCAILERLGPRRH
ncbi:hypothetical protein AMTRI_Chr02g257680 [Amborella trichopoda]